MVACRNGWIGVVKAMLSLETVNMNAVDKVTYLVDETQSLYLICLNATGRLQCIVFDLHAMRHAINEWT